MRSRMDVDQSNEETAGADPTRDDDDGNAAVGADDERENREQIANSGEPRRDALGNADGAS